MCYIFKLFFLCICHLFLCEKLPQHLAARNNKTLSHSTSVGQEFRSGSAGRFWLSISPEVAVRMLPGAASSEGSTGAVGPAPRWFTHQPGRLEMPISRWPQFFSVKNYLPPQIEPECPHDLVLAFHRVKKPIEKSRSFVVFVGLTSHFTVHHFCNSLLVT